MAFYYRLHFFILLADAIAEGLENFYKIYVFSSINTPANKLIYKKQVIAIMTKFDNRGKK